MERVLGPTSTLPRPGRIVAAGIVALALLWTLGCSDRAGSAPEPVSSNASSDQSPEPGKGAAMGLAAIDSFIADQNIDTNASGWKTSLPKPPQAEFADDEKLFWNLETNVGAIKIALLPAVAPMHVTSTVYLTKLGFYDDVVFHRVIDGFMAQGGDPLGRGTGGPGYQYDGEFDSSVRHDRPGLLSMANAGPGTDGSQFFITFVPTPHLDGKHTIFGEVVGEDSMATVRELEKRGSRSGRTTEPLQIDRATITAE
jgi:cyclophilin family peptidyl-prolyl cis-trans isomerase